MKKLLRHFTAALGQSGRQLDFFAGEDMTGQASSSPPARDATPAPPLTDPLQRAPAPVLRPAHPAPTVPPAPLQVMPSPPPLEKGKRRIRLDTGALDYTLQRSKRRSIGLVVDDEGLRITAPKWVGLAEIEAAILEKQRWIVRKLAERHERKASRLQPQVSWQDGATLPYLGGELTLRIATAASSASDNRRAGARYDAVARELTVSLPADHTEQQLKDRVLAWLQTQARELYASRLPVYAEKLGVQYKSFTLSSAMTQWGSCTADGRIRLNWRLMHFGIEQIDYVIAHELSHLREMNHSPAFWATVQSVFPEFAAARKTLRERGPDMLPKFR